MCVHVIRYFQPCTFLLETGKHLKFPPNLLCEYTLCYLALLQGIPLPASSVAPNVRFVCFSKCHLTGQNGTLISRQKNFSLLLCWPWKNAIFSWITSYKCPLRFNHFAAGWSCWLCQFSLMQLWRQPVFSHYEMCWAWNAPERPMNLILSKHGVLKNNAIEGENVRWVIDRMQARKGHKAKQCN